MATNQALSGCGQAIGQAAGAITVVSDRGFPWKPISAVQFRRQSKSL
jgi:hypothetical protein